MLSYQIDFKELEKFLKKNQDKKKVKEAVLYALNKVALAIRSDVIPRTPRGVGDLVNSWRVEKKMDDYLEIGFDIIYAAYQERGKREDGSYVIQNRPGGGETGYLQNTIDENLDSYYDLFINEFFNRLWR